MTEGIRVEVAKITDAKELLEIYAPYVKNTAISFEVEVPGEEEFASRIQTVLQKYPYLVAKKDAKILGYAYVSPFKTRAAYDWCVETSIYIREDCRRMGIGSLLYDKLEEVLKKMGILNMNACIAYPAKEDEHLTADSVAFHEKMGFSMVGRFHECGYKFDHWYDMVWMEKLLGIHESNQNKVDIFTEKMLNE